MECNDCGSERIVVNGDDTGRDWYECLECGSTEFDERPTQGEVTEALRAHSRRMHG